MNGLDFKYSTKFGITEKAFIKLVDFFTQYVNIQQVIIYGSRAKGNFREGSDIDLCIKGTNLSIDFLLQMKNKIDNLDLPYKIDLSIYNFLDNQELISHIDRIGRVFYSKE